MARRAGPSGQRKRDAPWKHLSANISLPFRDRCAHRPETLDRRCQASGYSECSYHGRPVDGFPLRRVASPGGEAARHCTSANPLRSRRECPMVRAMESSPRIFISYSRGDGRDFAEAFERRLEHDAGIRSWRDLKSMGSGEIRPQVLRAIEQTQHLVLILSRRALASDWVKREWTHAREWGRMVSPVLADPTLKRADLPGWVRRSQTYDIDDPAEWRLLTRVLEGPGDARRVPYMAGDLAEDFIPRPTEYERLKQAVLAAGRD